MPRVPYVDAAIAEPAAVVSAVRRRRGGNLYHLDRMLLHSPPLAAGWNALFGAVRGELALEPRLLELAICLVAVVNEAAYEFAHHEPLYAAAGATAAQLEALGGLGDPQADVSMFDRREQAVINITRELTRDAEVSDATFAAGRACFPDERTLVELVGVIAAYNMVSRFLNAFDIEPET